MLAASSRHLACYLCKSPKYIHPSFVIKLYNYLIINLILILTLLEIRCQFRTDKVMLLQHVSEVNNSLNQFFSSIHLFIIALVEPMVSWVSAGVYLQVTSSWQCFILFISFVFPICQAPALLALKLPRNLIKITFLWQAKHKTNWVK